MVKPKVIKTNFEMAVYNADYDLIVDLAAQHRSKKNSFSFYEELKHIKEDDLNKLMKQLLKILMEYIEKNLGQSASVDWTVLSSEQCKSTAQFIQATTDIGLACIHCDYTSICRIELAQIAVFLHGIMLPMPDNMDYVKNFISHYCEKLFSSGILENCEIFLSNVVLYLVRKTLVKRALKTDVKRLYSIRKILKNVMEENGPIAVQLWPLFSDCIVSDTYLSLVEGQKIIALVMTLDADKLIEIHEKILSYVPCAPIRYASSYGRVYFEAWCYTVKSGNNEMRDIIEITCLQQLILMAMQHTQRHITTIVRKMLQNFFKSKKEREVSKMLYSIYQPLVWRYLKNPNGFRRSCAAQLFLDVFPLEDPDARVVKNDMELNDQLLMIRDLLLDDFPLVRITALLGVCLSMSVNWEVFPEEMLKTLFRTIVNDLSRDSATSEVRMAVVKGVKCLLENPLAMGTLVHILPKLGGLFHDVSENVRIGFCQLLLRVKKISAIKYFDIVPTPHLFARMEEDCHAVKKCLTNLLHNSYFPKNQDPKLWLGRCLEIIKTERIASRVFFSYVSGFIGVDQSVKFMVLAAKAVHFYVKTKSSPSHVDMEVSDKENIKSYSDYVISLEDAVGFDNLNIVSTMMEAIAVMWLSLKPESEKGRMVDNKKSIKMLVGRLGTSLSDLCLYYKNTEAWEPVFYLSSFLPSSQVPSLASLCFMKLKNLPPDAQEYDYMTLLECLANQSQMLELLNIIKEWIEAGLNSSYVPPAKKRRGRGKSSEGIHQEQTRPYLANRMLNSILNHRNLQKNALLEHSALQEILYLSDNVQRKLEKVNARLMGKAEADFLDLFLYNVIRITVLLHNFPNYDQTTSVPFLNEFVQWTSMTLVKHISPVKDKTNQFTSLVLGICKNLCKVLGDVTALGFLEPENCLYLDFVYSLLRTDFGHEFLFIASRFLYKHAASSQFMILLDCDTVMMKNHLHYLNLVFDLIKNEAMLKKIPDTELEEIIFTLANVMQIVHNHVNKLAELSSQVFKCILNNILDCSATKCAGIVEEMAEDPFDRLSYPPAGNFFWSIISLKPKLNETYVIYLADTFKNLQFVDVSYWIAYWMIIWNFLHTKSISQPAVKHINSLVLQLEKCIHNIYPLTKDSEQNNIQDSSEPVPLLLFQRHCHAELIKLKKRAKSKLNSKS